MGTDDLQYQQLGAPELRKLFTQHQDWLKFDGFIGKKGKLSNLDLSRTHLTNISLSIQELDFSHIIMTDVSLEGNTLQRTNFSGSQLTKVNFKDCNLVQSIFSSANLDSCKFQSAFLSGVGFSNSLISQCEFYDTSLQYSDLTKSIILDSTIENADLRNTSFLGAILENSSMKKSILQFANFSKASLDTVNLQNCDLLKGTFSDAEFHGCDFENSKMDECNFESASLAKSNLKNVKSCDSNFRDANLEACNFLNAGIVRSDFTNANLHDAKMTTTNLQDCDFEMAMGLTGRQFAGSNVSGAKLPNHIVEFKLLEHLTEIAKNAKKLFVALNLGSAYSLLTIVTANDTQLLSNASSAPLPFISAQIPIGVLFIIVPLLLLGGYIWFNLYLQRYWAALAKLPARFPDGNPIHQVADPWILNSMAQIHFKKLKHTRTSVSLIESSLSIFFAWWIVPITLLIFWLRYLPIHNKLMTLTHASFVIISIFLAVRFYQLAVSALNEKDLLAKIKTTPETTKNSNDWNISPIYFALINSPRANIIVVLLTIILGIVSDGAIHGTKWLEIMKDAPAIPFIEVHRHFIPRFLPFIGARAFADFSFQEVSKVPSNLTTKETTELSLGIRGIQLNNRELQFANGKRAILIRADFHETDLRGANLEGAILLEANLSFAKLQYTMISGTNFQGANLLQANLTGSVSHRYSDFDFLDPTKKSTHLQTNFVQTILEKGTLKNAKLAFANFQNSNLKEASLDGADLRHASLLEADLHLTSFLETRLEGADLSSAKGLRDSQISRACIDKNTKLPAHIDRPKPCTKFQLK